MCMGGVGRKRSREAESSKRSRLWVMESSSGLQEAELSIMGPSYLFNSHILQGDNLSRPAGLIPQVLGKRGIHRGFLGNSRDRS